MNTTEKQLNINCLQIIFNKILDRMMQSSFDKCFDKFIKTKLEEYFEIRLRIGSVDNFSYRDHYELMRFLYNDLNSISGKESRTKKIVKVQNKFNYEYLKNLGWQYSAINFLQKRINLKLNNFVESSFVHGSFATRDFVNGWSDLDVKIIFKNSVFENKNNLKYVHKYLRNLSFLCDKIDPLCHHRFSYLTQFDMDNYPEIMMPLESYRNALLLGGQENLEFGIREDREELKKMMKVFVKYFEEKIRNKKSSRNLKEWKDDIAHLTLWPSLLLQNKGIYIYKKDSFERAEIEFPQFDFKIIKQAGEFRKRWQIERIYYPNIFLVILPFKFNRKIVNLWRKKINNTSLCESHKIVGKFINDAYCFVKKTYEE